MLRAGLTGGIACGKTTVARMMRDLGCAVIEADPIAHQLSEPGQTAYDEIVQHFSRQILGPDNRIDRGKLAGIVFNDPSRLEVLHRILHPRVIEVFGQKLDDLTREGRTPVSVIEAALLVEANYHAQLDRLVVAWCRPEQQLERLLERGLSREDALRRIQSQMPLEEKRRHADDEIDCSGTLEHTRGQVEALVLRLRQLAAA